jgi:hypothetical protein
MGDMQRELQEFIEYVEREIVTRTPEFDRKIQHALVKVSPQHAALAKPVQGGN